MIGVTQMDISKGAKIIIGDWLNIKDGEKLLIITDGTHINEAGSLRDEAEKLGAIVVTIIVPENSTHNGYIFEDMESMFVKYDAIIGATNYSLITTNTVKYAIERQSRFLSLPLSVNNDKSLLSFEFINMDTKESKEMGNKINEYLNEVDSIRITTKLGTDLSLGKCNRRAGVFNGQALNPGDVSSSSFEVYIGVEESKTQGKAILDGSFGYLGVIEENTKLVFENGRLIEIEETPSGKILKEYMDSFEDERIYTVGELGIGLNKLSRCNGSCYIEDESAYGTFHLGMGRNIALGGIQDAKGHFDLVFHNPDIYAGETLIIKDGKIII